jgi:predicted DNA-binding protein
MRKRSEYIHISITPEIHAKLKELAEKQGRTLTELVREAIGKLLLEYSKFDINNPNQ